MKKQTKWITTLLFTGALALSLIGCSSPKESTKNIVVGASPAPHAEILEFAKPLLAEKGYTLEIKEFTDYVLPNTALDAGDLDANYFQHVPYLENFNENNGTKIVSAASIHFEPLGLYAGKTASLDDLKEGAQIAIPSDTTNEARALNLLASLGYITLEEGVGLEATPRNIVENPYNLTFLEVEAALVPRTLPDVDFGISNGNYALDAGITDLLLTSEPKESEGAQTFANILAVKEGRENDESTKALIEVLTSDAVRDFILEKYNGIVVPVF
jgi:D-methionine transport system substrate-binding protein